MATSLLLALLAWLTVCLLLWLGQERLIFFPRPLDNADRARLAEHELQISAPDGTRLSGWAIAADSNKKGAIMYFGGNGQEISYAVEEIPEKLGLTGAGFNYRGYGDSGGTASANALRSDALVGFDAAVERLSIPAEHWIVYGRSLGSHMAAHVAANRPVAGVVLTTPFDGIASIAARRYPIFPVRTMLRHPFDTLAETKQITADVLVIRASHDRVVPASSTNILLDNWHGDAKVKVVEIPNSSHNDLDHNDQYWEVIKQFCDNALQEELSISKS